MERHPDEELHERALQRFEAMSPEQRTALLERAGILDEDGHLAERYRPPSSNGQDRQRHATDSR